MNGAKEAWATTTAEYGKSMVPASAFPGAAGSF